MSVIVGGGIVVPVLQGSWLAGGLPTSQPVREFPVRIAAIQVAAAIEGEAPAGQVRAGWDDPAEEPAGLSGHRPQSAAMERRWIDPPPDDAPNETGAASAPAVAVEPPTQLPAPPATPADAASEAPPSDGAAAHTGSTDAAAPALAPDLPSAEPVAGLAEPAPAAPAGPPAEDSAAEQAPGSSTLSAAPTPPTEIPASAAPALPPAPDDAATGAGVPPPAETPRYGPSKTGERSKPQQPAVSRSRVRSASVSRDRIVPDKARGLQREAEPEAPAKAKAHRSVDRPSRPLHGLHARPGPRLEAGSSRQGAEEGHNKAAREQASRGHLAQRTEERRIRSGGSRPAFDEPELPDELLPRLPPARGPF